MIFHNFSVAFAVDCLRLFAATKTQHRVRVEQGHTMIEKVREVGEGVCWGWGCEIGSYLFPADVCEIR